MSQKWIIGSAFIAMISLSACHSHLNHHHAPGHDPDGPGNSENAQGQQ